MLNKNLAGFFAFFLGIFGVHRFYLGQWFRGALQFAGFWFFVFMASTVGDSDGEVFAGLMIAALSLAPIITAIVFWATPEHKWRQKYDKENADMGTPQGALRSLPAASSTDLKAEGIRYYRTGDYDLAIEAFQEAADADLGDPGTHFNLACSYAQLGQYGEALRHLELSITFGLPKPERIERHPALAALRKHDSYKTFRENNFRRLDIREIANAAQQGYDTTINDEKVTETIEDFNRPPETETRNSPAPDLLEQITRLRELHDAGVLTQTEYQAQKEKLMG